MDKSKQQYPKTQAQSYLDPYLEKHKKEISGDQFPEAQGMGINFHEGSEPENNWSAGCVVANGSSPTVHIQDEVGVFGPGILNSVREGVGTTEAVAESVSPTLISAPDFVEKLERMPHSMRVAALINPDEIYTIFRSVGPSHTERLEIPGSDLTPEQEELVVAKILEDYRSQGHEVAVEQVESPQSFADRLIDMMDKIQIDTPSGPQSIYINQAQQQMYEDFMKKQEQSLLFGSGVPQVMTGPTESHRMITMDLTDKDWMGHTELLTKDEVANKYGDMMTATGLAMMSNQGLNLPNPLNKPIIEVGNP